jgi:hypothetical protein
MLSAVSNFCHNQTSNEVLYNRRNPQTLVVLVPILSLFVQNIQVNSTKKFNSPIILEKTLKQLDINYTWNALGALAQTITFVTLAVFANSLLLFLSFAALSALSIYQFSKSTNGMQEMNKKLHDSSNLRVIDKIWKVLSTDNP